MELTQQYSPLQCEPPKITFVGRPLDPNKGLKTLLEALELLLSLPEAPIFNFWIIGGEPDESSPIARQIKLYPKLNDLLSKGMINLWGRVKREALPEFYKRSYLLIMPSHREPFGLVAIESMLCGCPVIGTKQGGLSDTIIHGITGMQVEMDSPKALANAILLYLRNPQIRNTRSYFARQWAKFAFAKSKVYEELRNIYYQNYIQNLDVCEWGLKNEYINLIINTALKKAEELLGCPVQIIDILSSRYHVVAKIKANNNFYVLKQFRIRPSLRETVLPIGGNTSIISIKAFVENARFHADAPYMSKLIAHDDIEGIVIYDWLEKIEISDYKYNITSLIEKIRGFGNQFLNKSEIPNYVNSIKLFLKEPSINNLKIVDKSSFLINQTLNNYIQPERETYPIVGLYRLLICSEAKGWVLDEDVLLRIKAAINSAISLCTPDPELINFCHGGMKKRHIFQTKSDIYAIDTEHSVFAVGNLDIGVWMCSLVAHGISIFNLIQYLKKIKLSEEDIATAMQWFVYFLIIGYLERIHHGDIQESTTKIKRILYDFSLSF